MEQLKPCPFCGGDPVVIRSKHNKRWFARCFECDTLFGYSYTSDAKFNLKKDCIAAWNRRAQENRPTS